MSDAQIQTTWARTLMAALQAAGVDTLVISPGSRSTPLVAAAVHAGVRCHAIVDERAASFFALGRARRTGMPVALLCTSGTAGCHYYPAIVEAAYSATPLVAITADRPPERHGCMAPQAIDQTRLFGDHVRVAIDVGCAHAGELSLRALARKVVQAVMTARSPLPGPVHVNVPARKPLEPVSVAAPPSHLPRLHPPTLRASDDAIAELVAACRRSARGVIVAGPMRPEQRALRPLASALAARTGYPILAEATSQLRLSGRELPAQVCDAIAPVLSSPAFAVAHQPELIIGLGAPPAGWELAGYLETPGVERFALADHGWPDAASTVTTLIAGDPADTLARVLAELGDTTPLASPWARDFQHANALAWSCVEAELATERDQPGEDQVMRAVAAAIPDGALLQLGNSLPVRTIDWFCPGNLRDLTICHQRGANGIDGLIAGAIGAASAHDGPAVLLLGDVSFAHDASALAVARQLTTPLAIVVLDNGGGRIFDYLPIAATPELATEYRDYWLAPQSVDVCAVASAYGLRARQGLGAQVVAEQLRDALDRGGCTVIHAPVAPTSARDARRRIADAFDEEWRRRPRDGGEP